MSFELPASLAFDAQGSIDAAMRLRDLFDRDERADQGARHR